ncbi:hypothetical protein BCR41DRAFT_374006 [Lobosporangium transversale]|uniref:Uncharacterized protein n=1 Tax=Lobosporangium transversale TaxID=64571 RepID=A0A1Y2GBX8_9FUNG|nr:hypothetical protein BCR41DRAFT_374006 [Lobosporangium transversale]ORZ06593.1 hypothetical protein BCR41DRAFT_374006 [Lobosporangium transversale]|eukprot:XP_021877636.1 hypothetical protein BCR41DRAFT_374006 [Lobosporangium transversale]
MILTHTFTIQAPFLVSPQMHPSCTKIIGFLSEYLAMLNRRDAMIVEINSLADSQARDRLSSMHKAIMLSGIVGSRSLSAFAVYTGTTALYGGMKPMMISSRVLLYMVVAYYGICNGCDCNLPCATTVYLSITRYSIRKSIASVWLGRICGDTRYSSLYRGKHGLGSYCMVHNTAVHLIRQEGVSRTSRCFEPYVAHVG